MDRRLRLRQEWEIEQVHRRGRGFAHGPVAARVLAREDRAGANRYAVVAGKRVGGAVARNRCKRLIREALRSLHPSLQQGYDIVVTARAGPDVLTSPTVAHEALEQIFRRAGLLDAHPAQDVEWRAGS